MNGRIAFENSDRLCLDGQRLVLVNKALSDDNYWADDAQYRTELDSFSLVKADGAGAARSFKVWAKDGRVLTYGAGTGRVAAYGAVKAGAQSWALARIEDRSGNYIALDYKQDSTTGEHLLSTMRLSLIHI